MRNNHALRHRCPRCKKVRRFHDIPNNLGRRTSRVGWVLTDNVWVCGYCLDPEGTKQANKERKEKAKTLHKAFYRRQRIYRLVSQLEPELAQYVGAQKEKDFSHLFSEWLWIDEILSMLLDGAPEGK